MTVAEQVEKIVLLMSPVVLEEGTASERASRLREVARLAQSAAQGLCEARKVVLAVPGDPNELSPNARMNRGKKMRLVEEWRTKARRVAEDKINRGLKPFARARISFVICRGRRVDEDNLNSKAIKACQDGLVDAGLLRNDTARYVSRGTVTQETGVVWRERPEVLIVVEEIAE